MATNDCTNLLNNAVNEINVLSCNQDIINNNVKVLQEEINALTDEINDIKMGNDVFVGSIENNATEIDFINNVSILDGEHFTLPSTADIRDGLMKVLVNGNDNSYILTALSSFSIICSTYDPINRNIYISFATSTFILIQTNYQRITGINNIVSYNIDTQTFNYLGTPASNGVNVTQGVKFLKYLPGIQKVIVAGTFTAVSDNSGTKTANRIALWDIQSGSWELLGTLALNGVNSTVNSCDFYEYASNKYYIYVGGSFTQVSDSSGNKTMFRIARWDTNSSSWDYLGTVGNNGVNGTVNSVVLVDISSVKQVYIGGSFTQVSDSSGNKSMNNVARWNLNTFPNQWEYLGIAGSNGTNNQVNAILQYNRDIYMTGTFTAVSSASGTTNVNYVVIYDTTNNSWTPLGLATPTSNGFLFFGNINIVNMILFNNNIYFFSTNNSITAVADMISIKRPFSNSNSNFTYYYKWNTVQHIWDACGIYANFFSSNISNIDSNSIMIGEYIVYPQQAVSVDNDVILYQGINYKNMKLIPKGANISIIWSESLNCWVVYGQLPNSVILIQVT